VLEGGQDKEDAKRDEIFYNKILASDEIDRLFEPKVLTNFRKFDKDGEHKINEITENDNLIIKGNNLLALHSLKKKYAGKVKLIYIDPPYNTSNDGFNYNDSFSHSTWLTFIKNRLEISRELLREDGTIFVSCDTNNQAYIKLLLDELFKRENYLATVAWKQLHTVKNSARYFSNNLEFILVFAKSISRIENLRLTVDKTENYPNDDGDGRGKYKYDPLSARNKNTEYSFKFEEWGIEWTAPKGSYPRYSIETLKKMLENDEIAYKDGWKEPRVKRYLKNVQDGTPPSTFWDGKDVGFSSTATSQLANILERDSFLSPKPIGLIKRILEIASSANDLVLDFCAGSGTTAQAVLELNKEDGGNRKFILVEQMDYIETVTTKRVHQVIKNDNLETSFVRVDLKESNEQFLNDIQTSKDLVEVLNKIKQSGFLTHKVDLEKLDENEFLRLSEDEQRGFLMELLDANHLYVNLNDIEDTRFKVSEEDKRLNKQFYSI